MESFTPKYQCPKCGKARMKPWDELTDEQKFLVERLPEFSELPKRRLITFRFCTRCWFGAADNEPNAA